MIFFEFSEISDPYKGGTVTVKQFHEAAQEGKKRTIKIINTKFEYFSL